MGSFFSRRNAGIEELDMSPSNAYRYPPRAGNYFASHFIMGGERFETTHPESYLFGENMDLNFLGGKPTPFPYPAPMTNEPTRTLRSLINIRKESLRFIRITDDASSSQKPTDEPSPRPTTLYNIEFIFDCDVCCEITIHYFCTEEITPNGVFYTPRDPSMSSETYRYKKGINQQFSQVSHVIDPSKFPDDSLSYKFEEEVIPVLIQCVAEEGVEEIRQSHMLIGIIEKNPDASYTLKPLKQKLFVDGLCYLLQEIYGIENKNVCESEDIVDEDAADSGSECVICMSDARDTLILPCRHLCLCNSCADSLRYQANNCPICRAPFRALLQIRAVRKSAAALPQASNNGENQAAQDVPPGYEPVSLIEALNGPIQPSGLLVPPFPPSVLPFSNSPDTHQKRHSDRHVSSSASSLRPAEDVASDKNVFSIEKLQTSAECSSSPEVVVTALISPEMKSFKVESLSLNRGDVRRHKKGFRTSSAPEKIRLLANSVQVVNEVGGAKRKMDKDAEAAETRSLLESNATIEETPAGGLSSKITWSCNRNSPVSLSTPHSLHLCEKSSKIHLGSDTSPGEEESDYYTPEDPSTTILVDRGTDTSLDTPQTVKPRISSDPSGKSHAEGLLCVKHLSSRDTPVASDNSGTSTGSNPALHSTSRCESGAESSLSKKEDGASDSGSRLSVNKQTLVVHISDTGSLPGTAATSTSGSGDDFGSTASTSRLYSPTPKM